ncbi:hypothetical protein LCGC14_2916780, partial [marine sediment metagenome]
MVAAGKDDGKMNVGILGFAHSHVCNYCGQWKLHPDLGVAVVVARDEPAHSKTPHRRRLLEYLTGDNGVPAEAAGYFEKLPEGMEIGEGDKAGMEKLAEAMHAIHAPP